MLQNIRKKIIKVKKLVKKKNSFWNLSRADKGMVYYQVMHGKNMEDALKEVKARTRINFLTK